MGVVIDTIGLYRTSGASADTALSATTVSPGDSLTVRNFASSAYAKLEQVTLTGETVDEWRITSPMLHDDVSGLTWFPGQFPAALLLARQAGVTLRAQDTLTVTALINAVTTTQAAALHVYYSDLIGGGARLHSWGDISGNILFIKPLVVSYSTAAPGNWTDTVLTTAGAVLHANKDYAVLGYVPASGIAAVGIKGTETSNFRVTGPGTTRNIETTEYFVTMAEMTQTPHIPVFNAANIGSTYLSLLSPQAASTSGNVTLILAELVNNLAS